MDSKKSNCTYFNKDIERIGPITSFVRYCVELSQRVDDVICKENHTLIHCILHKENKLIFVQKLASRKKNGVSLKA